jgi:hypothetical protein
MGVVVISKSPLVVVKPSEAVTATGDINLSSYDKYLINTPVTAIAVFEHPIEDPAEKIKRGLSQAVVHYYPIAGRLAAGATAGQVVIKCTMEGVAFVAASANCAIKDVNDVWDPSLKEELALFYPAADGLCRYCDPLLLMQVTVFSCGGFVLAFTFNHSVADGVGIGQFMQAVAELSRGLPTPSVVPVRQDDSLILCPPPVFTKFVQFLDSIRPSQMAVVDIAVKSTLIKRIKDKYASMNPGQRCTVFDAVAAVLWRCRTRVTMSDPEALTILVVYANARKYAGAREGYYGNCVWAQLVSATARAVANADMTGLVKMIQGAKDRVPDLSDMDGLLQMPDLYNLLSVNSWRNLVSDAIDFGSGKPDRVMGHSRGCQSARRVSRATTSTGCCPSASRRTTSLPFSRNYKIHTSRIIFIRSQL